MNASAADASSTTLLTGNLAAGRFVTLLDELIENSL
jgi:hypothetical protein